MELIFWILLGLLALSVVGLFCFTFPLAADVYRSQLVRRSKDEWARGVCSFPEDPEAVRMFNEGMAWGAQNAAHKTDLHIENDGLNLYGEWFDFGFPRTVFLLSGRAEALTYSYYFAIPYKALGYNVLVIDGRAHGKSDGKYNTVGLREYRDVLAWLRLLEKTGQRVLLHGVCIGSATALYAATDPACPGCVDGVIADGAFTTFAETFRTHMKQLHKPTFPVLQECMFLLFLHSGKNPFTHGPYYSVPRLKVPILFLHSREDVFSLPERAEQIIARTKSDKMVVWFPHGKHSHLRVTDPARYDGALRDFTESRFPQSEVSA